MPYRGLPSQGCQNCRIRKIKCDRREPTCENCSKSQWKCPGYRDTIDLLFHDESAKTVKKVKAAKAKATINNKQRSKVGTSLSSNCKTCKRIDVPELRTANHQPDTRSVTTRFHRPELSLSFDLDDLAIGYFFHYYTIGDTETVDICQALDSSDCLKAAILALGSAAVTNSGPGIACSAQTQSRYTDAIHATNMALQSTVHVRKDSTLLAVNLLGIFEIKNGSQMRLESWHEHVHGAAALLAYRGATQFQSSEGGRLFMQTVSSLIASSVFRRLEIPPHVISLIEEAETQIPDPSDWDWRCFRLNVRFASLCARLSPNNLVHAQGEIGSILREAWSLDEDMIELLNDTSDDWHFKVIHTDGFDIFCNRIYAYPHYFAAQQYNGVLVKRIILQDIMLKILWFHSDVSSLQLCPSQIEQIRNASVTIRKLQLDILRSAPQNLGTPPNGVDFLLPFAADRRKNMPRDKLWKNFMIKDQNPWRSRPQQDPVIPTVRTCCGYTAHWPLYIAGAADAIVGEFRNYAIQSLRVLGNGMGLHQAFLMADRLENGEKECLNAHIEFSKEIMY